MNNVGRFAASSKKNKIQVLAAARLHRCPGLFSVLTALKEYREACSKGTCAVSPSNAFHPDALDWFDSELQEEKSSWNTQKKSNEGAQVKKGLKTPYCRVGERPGLRVYIYIYILKRKNRYYKPYHSDTAFAHPNTGDFMFHNWSHS